MMKTPPLLLSPLLLLLTPTSRAFVVLPQLRHGSRVAVILPRHVQPAAATRNDDDDMEADAIFSRLQSEYQQLQKDLLRDLNFDTQVSKETMMERLVDAAAAERYQQMKRQDEAAKQVGQAADDKTRAQQLKDQVRHEAQSAQHEAALLESMDADYQDLERLRDLAVVHADQQLELDAEVLELQSEYHAELAQEKEQKAAKMVQQLQEYEARLVQSLKELHKIQSAKAVKDWKEQEATKHELFLEKIKASIDNDPYFSNKMRTSSKQHTKASRNEMAKGTVKHAKADKLEASIDNDKYLSVPSLSKDQIEHSIDDDPYLDTKRSSLKQARATQNEVSRVKRTTKVDKIEASIDNDNYLSQSYLSKDLIEHSIDDDPYLDAKIHSAKQTKASKNEMALGELNTGQPVDKVEASIDNDPYLSVREDNEGAVHMSPDQVEASIDDDPYLADSHIMHNAGQSKASRNEIIKGAVANTKDVDQIEASIDNDGYLSKSWLSRDQIEHSIDDDPYLDTRIHSAKQSRAAKNEMTLGRQVKPLAQVDQVQASIDNDPYLSAMGSEDEVHVVSLDQVEASIDNDPYLADSHIVHNAAKSKASRNEMAQLSTRKVAVDQVQASIDNDADLA